VDFALLGLGGGDGDGEPQSAAAGVWDVKLGEVVKSSCVEV